MNSKGFRPLSGLCLLFPDDKYGYNMTYGGGFRPLSGLCLLFSSPPYAGFILFVSVPFRGYVSYSFLEPILWQRLAAFPSPFGVMSLILISSVRRLYSFCFRPLSGLCILFIRIYRECSQSKFGKFPSPFGVMSLIRY